MISFPFLPISEFEFSFSMLIFGPDTSYLNLINFRALYFRAPPTTCVELKGTGKLIRLRYHILQVLEKSPMDGSIS